MDNSIHTVRRLDLPVDGAATPWAFARDNAEDIATYFAELQVETPQIWNGEVLMARNPRVEGDCFRAEHYRTDYASYLAWRGWGFPDKEVFTAFGMGAVRSADGAFMLGEMGRHTANRGRIYFPAGTPEPGDIVGGVFDIAGSVAREVTEEIGLAPSDYVAAPDWTVIFDGQRIALIRLLQSPLSAAALRHRIESALAQQAEAELAAIHPVRGVADLTPAMPSFVATYLRRAFA